MQPPRQIGIVPNAALFDEFAALNARVTTRRPNDATSAADPSAHMNTANGNVSALSTRRRSPVAGRPAAAQATAQQSMHRTDSGARPRGGGLSAGGAQAVGGGGYADRLARRLDAKAKGETDAYAPPSGSVTWQQPSVAESPPSSSGFSASSHAFGHPNAHVGLTFSELDAAYTPPCPLRDLGNRQPLSVLSPVVAGLAATSADLALSSVKGDDLAVLVFEARHRLKEAKGAREASQALLATARERAVGLREAETAAMARYAAECDTFESFVFDAVDNSKSVAELDALEELTRLRLRQDTLTLSNLRAELDGLLSTSLTTIARLRERRRLAEERRRFNERAEAVAVREGQRMRETVRALEAEASAASARLLARVLDIARREHDRRDDLSIRGAPQ